MVSDFILARNEHVNSPTKLFFENDIWNFLMRLNSFFFLILWLLR